MNDVYSCDGMLNTQENEQTIDAHTNMDKWTQYNIEWKETKTFKEVIITLKKKKQGNSFLEQNLHNLSF